MHFLVTAYDGTDEQAPSRRLAARERHLASIEQLKSQGKALYGAALIDDRGAMIGSLVIYEFDSREEFDEYLKSEPYVTGKVWEKIEVKPCRVPPIFLGK
ncbi:MAG TPA: YciI family protein [Deltaproteobacteria bacterium]|jgi:hypothetical protein|nr:YciI family protein [Deltaproteobacteria bacterium]HQI00423.1 YciI family protein [Deltaproteobacteria bacterium]HQJ07519.1 YciI family protein [Deltaproteobacteria bacterium]